MIRQAYIEDCNQLADIEAKCFPQEEAATLETIKERMNTFIENFLIIEENNQIIGFINGCTTDKPELPDILYHDVSLHHDNGDYQTVFGLSVLPKYQHKGYASQLMRAYIDLSIKRNKKGIVLTCKDHLIGFYESFGYQHMGVSDSTHGKARWNDMLLMLNKDMGDK